MVNLKENNKDQVLLLFSFFYADKLKVLRQRHKQESGIVIWTITFPNKKMRNIKNNPTMTEIGSPKKI